MDLSLPAAGWEQLPPHDVAAEEAVLGSLLVDDEAIFKVASFLGPADFFREKHRWIYEACLALSERNEALNQITISYELAQRGRLEAVGGSAFLSHLIAILPTSVHVEYYGQIVQRTALLRRLIEAGGKIVRLAYEASDAEEALARSEELLYNLRQAKTIGDFVHIREVLSQYLEEHAREPSLEHLPSVKTSFLDLDGLLGGIKRADLIILAARPSLGKTSLALNIALDAALRQGATVGLFSLEMAKEQVVQRLLSVQAGVDSQRLRLDHTNREEERKIMEATGVLSEAPIYIDDSPLIRVAEMRSKARRLHNERGLDLLVVDYLQLIRGPGNAQNRVQEMGEISRSLKGLARELEVPVLAISQLSRAPEARASHVPQLSDLRESGSIEQDADVVLFLYRDDAYYTEKEWNEAHFRDGAPYPKGIVDVIVAKHRNGPIGRVQLLFFEKTTRFVDLARREKEA